MQQNIKVMYSCSGINGMKVLINTSRTPRVTSGFYVYLVNRFNHTCWDAVVTPIDRPKSVSNRCEIKDLGVVFVLLVCFIGIFCCNRDFFSRVNTLVFYCVCQCGATSGIQTFSMSQYLGILLRVPLWRYIRYRDFFSQVYILVFYCVCHCGATSGIGTFSHKSISWYFTACAIVALHQV